MGDPELSERTRVVPTWPMASTVGRSRDHGRYCPDHTAMAPPAGSRKQPPRSIGWVSDGP